MGRTVQLKSEMARAYGVSLTTLRKWLKLIGIHNKTSKHLSPDQIEKLEEEYGEPDYALIPPKPIGSA